MKRERAVWIEGRAESHPCPSVHTCHWHCDAQPKLDVETSSHWSHGFMVTNLSRHQQLQGLGLWTPLTRSGKERPVPEPSMAEGVAWRRVCSNKAVGQARQAGQDWEEFQGLREAMLR